MSSTTALKTKKAVRRDDPEVFVNHVLLDICSACGADCIYCLHQAAGLTPSKLMKPEHFQAIVEILRQEKYELIYVYQSGEAFLHPQYPDFLPEIAERGMDSSTATKLFMPIKWDRLDAALERCDATDSSVEFLITIDAITQEAQSKIGPGIQTEMVKANLVRMAEMQEKHPSVRCLLDTVVNAHNEHDIDVMLAYFKELGFLRWFPKQMGYFMPYHAREQDIENIAAAEPKTDRCPARFTVRDGEIFPTVVQTRCDLGAPAISPEGDVTICCHDMLHRYRLGNVVEQGSLRTIIASEAYQTIANRGRDMSLDICQGCN